MPQPVGILLIIIPLHVPNERPILVKLFMKLTLIMAQMITYFLVPSVEVLADIFTCLKSIRQAFRQANNRKMSNKLILQLFLKTLGTKDIFSVKHKKLTRAKNSVNTIEQVKFYKK